MTEQVIITDLGTTVASVTVTDSAHEIATIRPRDVASINGFQLDKLNSLAVAADVDSLASTKLAAWVQDIAITSAADVELATGTIPMPYFDPVGGRIEWYVDGSIEAAFASTIIVKVKGTTPSGITSTIATFTSTAVAGGGALGFYCVDVCMTALTRATQRLHCTFEYQGPSGAKVRETFWANGSYGFTADTDVRLDITCGAGTLTATATANSDTYVECMHRARRPGTW